MEGQQTIERAYRDGRWNLGARMHQRRVDSWATDIEHIVCRYGDRVRLAWDRVGTANATVRNRLWSGGLVSGLRLSQPVRMEPDRVYALDLRLPDQVITGVPIVNPATTAAVVTRSVMFADLRAANVTPRGGDLVAFGEPERISEDVEIIGITPGTDLTANMVGIRYVAPLLMAGETGPIPPLQSRLTRDRAMDPPMPTLLGWQANEEGVRIGFSMPPWRGSPITGFTVRWRQTPAAGQSSAWVPLPDLPANAMTAVTPPLRELPAEGTNVTSAQVQIVAVTADGRASPALQVTVQESAIQQPPSGDWSVTELTEGPDGSRQSGFLVVGLVGSINPRRVTVEYGATSDGPWDAAFDGPPVQGVVRAPILGMRPGAECWIAITYWTAQASAPSERRVLGPYTAPGLIAGDVSPTAPTIVAMQDAINLAEEGIGTINTAVASLNATVYTAGTGLKARSDAMFASLNTPTTGVLARLTATETAISTNNTAAVERLNALEATVNTAGTGLTARLATAESAITANNNAATSQLSALEATVNTAGTGLSARVAGLQTAVSDLNSGKANASDLATLQTEVTTARGGAASLNTRLNTVESTVAGKASASSVSALEATVNAAGTGLLARTLAAESAIVDLQGQKADASRVTALEAKAGGFNKQRNPRWLNGWDAWPIRIGAWSYSALLGGDASWALFGPATAGETALLYGEMIPWGENQPIGLLGRRYANGITSGVLQIYIGCYDAAGNSTGTRQAVQFFNGGYPAGQAVGAQTFAGQVGQLTPPGTTQVRVQIEAIGVNAGAYLGLYYVMPTDDPRRAFTDDATAQSAYSRVASLETATSNLQAGKADASRVTSLEAIVNTPGTGVAARLTNVESVAASADGRAKAIKGVVLDVNGYVSGYSSTNDGTSAAFEVSADKFGIRAPGSGERTEYRAGNWYVYSPSENTRTRYGKAFGGDQKLVWWTGPTSVEEGSETKGNAYVYMSQNTVGGPRFGGSDVIGPGGTLTATANTGFIGGGRSGAGYVNTSNQVTVTVSGGTSGATIRWTRISGDSRIQMNNATAFTTGAYATIGAGEVISAYFMGSITKGGQSAVVYVQVDLSDNGT